MGGWGVCQPHFFVCRLEKSDQGFHDRVSVEIKDAMDSKRDPVKRAYIAMAVRFRNSPRQMADNLAKAANPADALLLTKRGNGTYRQTGIGDDQLRKGLGNVAKEVTKCKPYKDWFCLEDKIAEEMNKHCKGNKIEQFAARQAAADLTQTPNWVTGMRSGILPDSSRTGCGAAIGHYFEARAEGENHGKSAPLTLPFLEQTAKCEYGKLVCRMNFPVYARAAVYKPCSGC